MAYTKITNYLAKDALLSGNPSKVVRGSEIDADFSAIEVADAQNVKTSSAASLASVTTTGGVTVGGALAVTGTSGFTGNVSAGNVALSGALTVTGTSSFTGAMTAGNVTIGNATVSSAVTLSGGTANGVVYLNGSKVVTSGSGFVFDGTNVSSTGVLTLSKTGQSAVLGDVATNTGTYFTVGGSISSKNWWVGGNAVNSGAFEIGQTTAAGGTTRDSTPLLTLTSTGKFLVSTTTAPGSGFISSFGTTNFVLAGGFSVRNEQTGIYSLSDNVLQFQTANAERARIDSSGNLLVTAVAGLGYGTGAGGTVTQATSKSTSVTLNKPCGQITMNNAALAANTTVVFTAGNTICQQEDSVVLNIRGGVGTVGSYNVWAAPGTNGFDVYVRNISGGSLSEAIVLNFAIIKGVTA